MGELSSVESTTQDYLMSPSHKSAFTTAGATCRKLIGVIAIAVGLLAIGTRAHSQEPLRKIKIGVGTLVLNAALPYVMLPPALGYWQDEGYDAEVFPAQSSIQAVQLLVAGNVDFIQVNSGPMLQAVVKNNLPLRSVMITTVIDWSLVSQADGPIKTLGDFKGKLIGVPALGAGGVALLEQYLSSNGINPKKDVELVAVGAGPAALAALTSGRVQGLMFWGSAIAGFEAAGAKLSYFFDPAWRKNADYMLATLQSTVARDPKMVEGIARGVAKASLFTVTNPDCVRRVHWDRYPDQKPSGTDQAALIAGEMLRINASVAAMKEALNNSHGKWGAATPEDFTKLEDLFIASKVIEARLANPADYFVDLPGFYDRVNTFDHAAIVRQATECLWTRH
jgi:NitT/TauT family transport system substrate-binding protein